MSYLLSTRKQDESVAKKRCIMYMTTFCHDMPYHALDAMALISSALVLIPLTSKFKPALNLGMVCITFKLSCNKVSNIYLYMINGKVTTCGFKPIKYFVGTLLQCIGQECNYYD